MSLHQATCPGCKTPLRLPAETTVQAVRCPRCATCFRVQYRAAVTPVRAVAPPLKKPRSRPNADRDRVEKRAAGNHRLPWAGIGIGAILLIVGGIVLAVSLNSDDKTRDAPEKDNTPVVQNIRPDPSPPNDFKDKPGALPEDRQPPAIPDKPPPAKDSGRPSLRPAPARVPEDRPPPGVPDKPPATAPVRPPPKPAPVVRKDPDPVDEGLTLPPPPDLLRGKERPLLVLDAGGHTALARTVRFTPDGKRALSAAADKTVRIWDVDTGETLQTLHLPSGPGSEGALFTAAVSPNGKTLAVSGDPVGRGALGILLYLIDMDTGQVQRILKGHTDVINGLVFSRDGRWLASASSDHTVRLYEHATGRTVRIFKGHQDRVKALALSPDGKWLATGSADKTGRVWSVATGQAIVELRGHNDSVISVAWSPDGRTIATGSVDGTIRLWTPRGLPRQTFWEGKNKIALQVTSLTFTRDSKAVLYTGIAETGKAGILDLETGKNRVEFTGHNNTVTSGHLSPDGSLAVSAGGNDNELFIWNTADGSAVHRLGGSGRGALAVAWSRDGQSIAWGNTNFANRAGLHRLERTFRLGDFQFGPAPTPDFVREAVAQGPYALRRVDFFKIALLERGQVRHVFKSPLEGDRIYSFSLIPGNRAVLGGSFGAFLVDLPTGRLLRRFDGHSGQVMGIAPSPNGRYFLTGSTDQVVCLWHPDRIEPILSLFFAGQDWIAWTPEGYYACSANGERLMGWQINNGPDKIAAYHPAARFRPSLYNPAAIRHLLRGAGGHVLRALALAARDGVKPAAAVDVARVLPPEVAIEAPAGSGAIQVTGSRVEVKAVARSTGGHPVRALRLLVDGRPYKGRKGAHVVAQPKPGPVEASWKVELPAGKHTLAVLAESAVSKGLSPVVEVTRVVEGEPEKPNLHILAVGVSAYPGRMRLNYAASDAVRIDKIFRAKSRGVFATVDSRLYLDRRGTRAAMLEGLAWLESVMTPRDVGIFFFSGHGAKDETDRFYLVPVDARVEDVAGSCLSGEVVKQALANMSGRMICMLDCCHSGSLAEGRSAGRPDDLMRDLVTDEYGVICMCSSLGREYSLESPQTRGGFFTLGVEEGMSGRADFNRDNVIHIHELDAYAAQRVKQLSGGDQNPVTGRPPGVRSFPLGRPAPLRGG